MFNESFFPTPFNVIVRMAEGLDLRGKIVLEPSAGKGDIADYIKDKYGVCLCIEKENELQAILADKGHPVIDKDFLTYEPDILFDYIIMNPPFNGGEKHLEKALEIGMGAEIRCLLPSRMVDNPNTKAKKVLLNKLDDLGAEFVSLGNCFTDAERKTSVDVVMVKVRTKPVEHFDFDLGFEVEEGINFDDFNRNELVSANGLSRMLDGYNAIKSAFVDMLKAKRKLQHYSKGMIDEANLDTILQKSSSRNLRYNYNNFSTTVKNIFWEKIFNKMDMEGKLTSSVKDDFRNHLNKVENLAFNEANIRLFIESLVMNSDMIFKRCVEEAFDYITKFYDENRYHPEGWKTNSQWMVNKKFILPRVTDEWNAKWNDVSLEYRFKENMDDIEKALANIEGRNFESVKTVSSFDDPNRREFKLEFGKWYESDYFKFKVFKKGTGHFKFKDEILWRKFNEIACSSKNWLGYK